MLKKFLRPHKLKFSFSYPDFWFSKFDCKVFYITNIYVLIIDIDSCYCTGGSPKLLHKVRRFYMSVKCRLFCKNCKPMLGKRKPATSLIRRVWSIKFSKNISTPAWRRLTRPIIPGTVRKLIIVTLAFIMILYCVALAARFRTFLGITECVGTRRCVLYATCVVFIIAERYCRKHIKCY